MEFKNLNQQKAWMKKEANRLGITTNVAYTTYYSRVLLERLALIYRGLVVVKGSFSQYVHLKSLSRPVLDIDLSSRGDHNVPLNLLYESMYQIGDDAVTFDLGSLPHQTKNGVYKIPVIAKVKYEGSKELVIPVPVDYKENNKVIFDPQFKKVEPLFEGDKTFYISTPSFEEHIAEKLFIISHNNRTDVENTRVKDFYDIYMLHGKDYDIDKFGIYFQAMVLMYGDRLDQVDAEFMDRKFIKRHEAIWERMKEKYQFTNKDIEFDEATYYAKAVLKEQIQKIRQGIYTKQAMKLARKKGK